MAWMRELLLAGIVLLGILLVDVQVYLNTGSIECSDMGIFYEHLRDCVVEPTLKELGLYSPAAVMLLLGTAAHESLGGYYLKQNPGPALGIYQMEPLTLYDVGRWLHKYPQWYYYRNNIQLDRVQWDLKYATVFARLYYYRVAEPLPEVGDLPGLARYWKQYWCRGCK